MLWASNKFIHVKVYHKPYCTIKMNGSLVHSRLSSANIRRGYSRRRQIDPHTCKGSSKGLIPWGEPAKYLYLLGKFSVVRLCDCEQSTISKGLVRKLREQIKIKLDNVSPGSLYLKLFNWDTADLFIFLNYCSQVWLPVVMAWIMFIFWKDGLFHLPFLLPSNMQLRCKSVFFFSQGNLDQNSRVLSKDIINALVTNWIWAFLRLSKHFLWYYGILQSWK